MVTYVYCSYSVWWFYFKLKQAPFHTSWLSQARTGAPVDISSIYGTFYLFLSRCLSREVSWVLSVFFSYFLLAEKSFFSFNLNKSDREGHCPTDKASLFKQSLLGIQNTIPNLRGSHLNTIGMIRKWNQQVYMLLIKHVIY